MKDLLLNLQEDIKDSQEENDLTSFDKRVKNELSNLFNMQNKCQGCLDTLTKDNRTAAIKNYCKYCYVNGAHLDTKYKLKVEINNKTIFYAEAATEEMLQEKLGAWERTDKCRLCKGELDEHKDSPYLCNNCEGEIADRDYNDSIGN